MLCSDAAFILSDMLPLCPPAVLSSSDKASGKCFFIFKFQDMLRLETKTAINLRKMLLCKIIPAAFGKHKLHHARKRILHYVNICPKMTPDIITYPGGGSIKSTVLIYLVG